MKHIHLWGVKQNNLKSIDVKIPIGSFTVICGPSGSGKSSLAFETLYAEGQRRYIESLSNYTKQFLNKAPKPDLEGIENIPPAISIEQKNAVKSSRSTVGTTTETIDYLRLLYEKVGKAYCPDHHTVLEKDSPSSATLKILREFNKKRGYILSPIYEEGRLLKDKKLLAQLKKDGFLRIYVPPKKKRTKKKATKKKTTRKTATKRVLAKKTEIINYTHVDMGEVLQIDSPDITKKGLPKTDFYLVIDRLAFQEDDKERITDSVSQAYAATIKYNSDLLASRAEVLTTDGEKLVISEETSCSICNYKMTDITSALFSFNSPVGACADCKGFGNILMIDEAKCVPNPELTIAQGALKPFAMPSARTDFRELKKFCEKKKIDIHKPWNKLSTRHKNMIWNGTSDFYGVVGFFDYLEQKKYKMHVRVFLARHKSPFTCPTCKGTRLKPDAQQVLIEGHSISDLGKLPISDLLKKIESFKLSPAEQEICAEPYRQLTSRLLFLQNVGVGYLTLDRPTKTLSGGEYQRLNLSNQLGVGLSQTLYVLDEPTVGLHPRDNDRLIQVLHQLNELGNTLVVVEHDHDVIHNSNHVLEMGPGSGHLGGEIIYAGDRKNFYSFKDSNTARYLKPSKNWVMSRQARPVKIEDYKYKLELRGATGNNLKDLDVTIPLNRLVTVTGVSGSGKSTLISNTLYPALARALKIDYVKGHSFQNLKGLQHVKNVLFIDQSPIGQTARSNPVTYLKIFDAIRTIFAGTRESKAMGYTPGTFSLNVDGGRCPVCKGLGHEVIDMMFMDDIEIPCDACDSKKYRPEILDIKFRGKSIHDVLNMTVTEAMDFFVSYPNIRRPLSVLKEVGLEYISLGQSARSLSGGESQRLKIAREFNSTDQRATLYILDEPTTGLHFREVHLLMQVLNRLVDSGGSVLLIEHNQEVIRNSDWVIDLGPEAGVKGGKIIAEGPPEKIMKVKKSLTGQYLKAYLDSITPK